MNMKNEEPAKKNDSAYIARSNARKVLVQMLYEWAVGNSSAQEVFDYRSTVALDADYTYLKAVFFTITEDIASIDSCIVPLLDRDISRLGGIELSILRLATNELKNLLEIPYKVVINEAVELAKTFGAQDSHKYVNAVLDKLSKQLRVAEM